MDQPKGIGFGCCPAIDEKIVRMARQSPVSAFAELMGRCAAPYEPNVSVQFATTTEPTQQGGWNIQTLGNTGIWIDDIKYTILFPQSFPGSELQSLWGYFEQGVSGMKCRISVEGTPRYVVHPGFVPLANAADFIRGRFPEGWFINRYQSISMDFAPGITPLPSAPCLVDVTFKGRQYVFPSGEMMTDEKALSILQSLGYPVIQSQGPYACDFGGG
jgi:hypothetical protein